jgi:hypothetical protein
MHAAKEGEQTKAFGSYSPAFGDINWQADHVKKNYFLVPYK